MAFNTPGKVSVEADAFVKASRYTDAEDVWEQINSALEMATHYDYEETRPTYLYDGDRVFKISIVIEEV